MTKCATLPFTADEMLAEARRETGIDIVDTGAAKPLTVLVKSYNEDGCFSGTGAQEKHTYLMRFLKNRLRMQRDIAAHPEILDIELKPPVVISGMGRTGSTKMQKVMIATGAFNWLTSWMGLKPASHTGEPNEDVSPRINEVTKFFDWFATMSPSANSGHRMAAEEADEDSYIMMHSLVSQTMTGYAAADSYMEWYMAQDHTLQFAYVRDTLKYLIWQGLADEDKPFVLKSAMSIGYEASMMRVFPDAHFVATHRDPKNVVPSCCKLIEMFRLPYSPEPVDHSGLLPALRMMNSRNIDYRNAHPERAYTDVDYRLLRDDAKSVVEQVFNDAGMPITPEMLDKVGAWEKAHPKNKDGGFSYSMEEFGLTPEVIDTAFGAYYAFLGERGINLK